MRFLLLTLVLLSFISCSKNEEPRPDCDQKVSFTLGESYAYTGDEYAISTVELKCTDQAIEATINGETVDVRYESEFLYLEIPAIVEDSASFTITMNNEVFELDGKVAIYPGNGSWNEVASFPGDTRGFAATFEDGSFGYILGGKLFDGYSNNTPSYIQYSDLYQYDAVNDSWSLEEENEMLLNMYEGVKLDESIHMFPDVAFESPVIYNSTNGTYGQSDLGSIKFYSIKSVKTEDHVFIVSSNIDTQNITINQFNPADSSWVSQSAYPATESSSWAFLNFVFVHENYIYVGYNHINEEEVILLKASLDDFILSEVARVELDNQEFPKLIHLFTIDNMAYFIESIAITLGENNVTVPTPSNQLYILNLKNDTWKESEHFWPEGFNQPHSFTAGNRGFAGMSGTDLGDRVKYSSKFYEFIPE